ncbi:MAG: hypothetical protein AAGC55_08820 [Myxococcota bacterium]
MMTIAEESRPSAICPGPIAAAVLAVWLALVGTATSGCAADAHDDDSSEDSSFGDEERELAELVEAGLIYQMPAPLADDQRQLYELTLERRQVAEDMAGQTRAVLVPLAVAAALFAPEGAAELALSILPVHRVGRAVEVARDAFKLRKKDRKARKLGKFADEFLREFDAEGRDFITLANKLARADRRALKGIFRHTGSPRLVHALMRRHLSRTADVRWIAAQLDRGTLRPDTARRLTFDAGLVDNFTGHRSYPSWRTLQLLVEDAAARRQGRVLPDGHRASRGARSALAGKVKGLFGERAAAELVSSPAFAAKYLGRPGTLTTRRGLSYRDKHCLDIVAFGDADELVVAEVKNWSADSWSNQQFRDRLLDQLDRHEAGIAAVQRDATGTRRLVGKVLIVERTGYLRGMNTLGSLRRTQFEDEVLARGWMFEDFPGHDASDLATLVNALL